MFKKFNSKSLPGSKLISSNGFKNDLPDNAEASLAFKH